MQVQCESATCGEKFEAAGNAASASCPKCGKAVVLTAPASEIVLGVLISPGPRAFKTAPATNGTNFPPYLAVPSITDPKLEVLPALESFQVLDKDEQLIKSYRIRVRRPKPPWIILLICVFLGLPMVVPFLREIRSLPLVLFIFLCVGVLISAIVIGAFLLLRVRGHTFLYLTNRRVTILELEQGLLRNHQAVCSFNIDDIAGFQLMAQRGLRKLLGLILLQEKRTFYLAIITRTCANVEIGAVRWRRGGKYDPGRDAVALCGELDAKVLALKAGRTAAEVKS